MLRPFGIFYDSLVIKLQFGTYIFPRFGLLCPEKSGNPVMFTYFDEKPPNKYDGIEQ
jgi:hypothetical protein